jgi:large subunit ribosomal protein L31
MKADIHPNYRDVVFVDVTSDFKILSRSTMATKETITWEDGNEYPLEKNEISSSSHPFYTGKHKVIDTSGRIDKFQKRFGKPAPAAAAE